MNRGLVVNSAPRARVWSLPLLLAMFVLLFPARSLEAAFEYCFEPLLAVSLMRGARVACFVAG